MHKRTIKHPRVTIITNGALFNNKLQPSTWFYSFIGLISYQMNGSSFRRIPWYGKVYLMFLSAGISYWISYNLIIFWKDDCRVTLRNLGVSCLYISSIMHVVTIWLFNMNTSQTIKIFKEFDWIETTLPKINNFLYNSNKINIALHIIQVIYLTADILIEPIIFNLVSCVVIYFNIVLVLSVHQFCIITNMISSYGSVLNISICKLYNRPEYQSDYRNPVMYIIRHKVFCFASDYQKSKYLIPITSVEAITLMCDKLLDNLQISNSKYNIVVSI